MNCPKCFTPAVKTWMVQTSFLYCPQCKEDITRLGFDKRAAYNKAWLYTSSHPKPFAELFYTNPSGWGLFETVFKDETVYVFGPKPQIHHRDGIDFLIDWEAHMVYYISDNNIRVNIKTEKIN